MPESLVFSFPTYAQALATVVQNSPQDRSFVVGITGPWGSGKTTLMEAAFDELGEADFFPVWFNAWAHSKHESVWRALFASIVAALRDDLDQRFPKLEDGSRSPDGAKLEDALDDAEKALYSAFTRETPGEVQLDAGQLAKTGAKLAIRFVPWGDVGSTLASWLLNRASDLGDNKSGTSESQQLKESDVEQLWGIFKRDVTRQYVAQTKSMEQFRNSIEATLKIALNDGRRLVVCIDDVDRCLPEQGLEVFEAIKLYLDLPGSIFFVAMDQDVLQHALDIRYQRSTASARRITSELYAEKMMDLTFTIPPYDFEGFFPFVDTLPLSDVLIRHYDLLSSVLPANPRTWERFANRTSLYKSILSDLANKRGMQNLWESTDLETNFLIVQLLNFRWPAIMRTLGSLEKLLILATCIVQAKDNPEFNTHVQNSGTIGQAVRRLATPTHTDELPEAIWPLVNDFGLITFLEDVPDFLQAIDKTDGEAVLLKKIFALDLPGAPSNPDPSHPTKLGAG